MPAFDFDVSSYDIQPARSFEPLPPGDYQAMVTAAELKDTKAGDGQYIELVIQITDGEHAGRRLWERLNIYNKNKQTEDIARSQLNSLGNACGHPRLTDTDHLIDVPFTISLDIDRRDTTRNKIMGYSAAKGAARSAPKPSAPVASGKRAWER